jgi:hypothetical protein
MPNISRGVTLCNNIYLVTMVLGFITINNKIRGYSIILNCFIYSRLNISYFSFHFYRGSILVLGRQNITHILLNYILIPIKDICFYSLYNIYIF